MSIVIEHKDAYEFLASLPSKSVQLIYSDPPYNTTQNEWEEAMKWEQFWKECNRILKDDGAIVLHSMQPFTTQMISSNQGAFKYCWYWDKIRGTGHLNAKKQPMRRIEDICVFYKKQCKYNPQREVREGMKVRKGEYAQSSNYGKSGGVRYKEPEPFYPTTLLTFSNSDQKSKIHPTQKPIDLAQYIVRTYTDEGDLVVDPFLGSGTCAEACLTEKRVFKGSEKNEQFYKAAKSRIDSLVVTMEVNDESEPVELPEAQKPTTRKRKTSSTNKEQAAAAAPKTAKRRKQT